MVCIIRVARVLLGDVLGCIVIFRSSSIAFISFKAARYSSVLTSWELFITNVTFTFIVRGSEVFSLYFGVGRYLFGEEVRGKVRVK